MRMKSMFRKMMLTTLSLAVVASVGGVTGSPSAAFAAEAGVSQAYESLFTPDKVINVQVTIDDEDWKSILANPLEKEYKSVTVDVDGTVLENVGFSTKGNLTLKSVAAMTDSDRYSFRLKFDKYDKTQTLMGLDKMVLNNSYSDPSFLREYLHYEALRAIGEDVPLTVFTNLYINGELYGFYIGVESVDDSYLERNFGEDADSGVLYDTEEKSYLKYEEGSDYETLTYDTGTEDDKASLKNFISVLNAMPDGEKGDIESVLDVDSALKYIAANAVLGNYDSYNGDKGHNYLLYGDAAGKYTVIPWDMNMSFNGYSTGGGGGRMQGAAGTAATGTTAAAGTAGTSAGTAAASATNAVTASIDTPTLGIDVDQVPLIGNLLEVPEYKTRYLGYVSELVTYLEGIQDRITGLASLIRPYVQADPTKFYTMDQFENNVAYTADAGGSGGMIGGGGNMTPPSGTEGTPPAQPDAAAAGQAGAAGGTTAAAGTASAGTTEGGSSAAGAGTADAAPGAGGNAGFSGAGGPQGGQGMGTMAAGSLMTFALNRLANLQAQLGLEVTPLPEVVPTKGSTAAAGTAGTAGSAAASSANKTITVTLNGTAVSFQDQVPLNKDGRVLVPVNAIFSALGADVTWDQTTKKITAVKGSTTITMTIGSTTAYVNGTAVTLDVPAQIINNRTMVPVRFISEGLNMDVKWDAAAQTVSATDKIAE
ncbi:spore coat protein H [Paenibacillus sp. PastF-1]|nr:spore coat protein H [Paenibacillus sp. PastF-2]MDF9851677.1 spore coat protein H [Paenibacillus sp. PastM-2]MDF9858261.1 spore coat protein H [Paenibacillus sp. PastF-1]MDH6483525.1 spore coat protein H [Paenibacillus sp. PastH-2]MDH6510951.1 spore coat protein H [Paenibacillus sp. PastM-3]